MGSAISYVDAWFNLGNLRSAAGNVPSAEEAYRGALAQHPAHKGSINNLAIMLAKDGRYTDSIRIYETALGLPELSSDTELNKNLHIVIQAQHADAIRSERQDGGNRKKLEQPEEKEAMQSASMKKSKKGNKGKQK
eukprot:gene14688-17353_t